MKLRIFSGHTGSFKIRVLNVQDFKNLELSPMWCENGDRYVVVVIGISVSFPGFYWFSNIFSNHLYIFDGTSTDNQSDGVFYGYHYGINGNTSLYHGCCMADQT